MHFYRCGLLVLLAFGLSACGTVTGTGHADGTSTEEIVNKLTHDIEAGINAGDAVQIAQLFTVDAVAMPAQQPAIEGRVAIEQFYRSFFGAYATTIKIVPLETQLIDTRGFSRGTYRVTMTPRTGEPVIVDEGKYIYLFQRQEDGKWRLTHDMSNSNLP
jgi:uncharacterized protein (TIGR02246 family)